MQTYKIVRFYFSGRKSKVIQSGLTLEEAQAHCQKPSTSKKGCLVRRIRKRIGANNMPLPKAYEPIQGYKYQILVRHEEKIQYEHCEYAKDYAEKCHLVKKHKLAYGASFRFKSIRLPKKYWGVV